MINKNIRPASTNRHPVPKLNINQVSGRNNNHNINLNQDSEENSQPAQK